MTQPFTGHDRMSEVEKEQALVEQRVEALEELFDKSIKRLEETIHEMEDGLKKTLDAHAMQYVTRADHRSHRREVRLRISMLKKETENKIGPIIKLFWIMASALLVDVVLRTISFVYRL
jgi:hypothetical protein